MIWTIRSVVQAVLVQRGIDMANVGVQTVENQLENMILAFKQLYASMDPQRNEPSEEYIAEILRGDKNIRNRELLINHAIRREQRKLMIESLTNQAKKVNTLTK